MSRVSQLICYIILINKIVNLEGSNNQENGVKSENEIKNNQNGHAEYIKYHGECECVYIEKEREREIEHKNQATLFFP